MVNKRTKKCAKLQEEERQEERGDGRGKQPKRQQSYEELLGWDWYLGGVEGEGSLLDRTDRTTESDFLRIMTWSGEGDETDFGGGEVRENIVCKEQEPEQERQRVGSKQEQHQQASEKEPSLFSPPPSQTTHNNITQKMTRILTKGKVKTTCLHLLCANSLVADGEEYMGVLCALVEAGGGELGNKDREGRTALHVAVAACNVPALIALQANGAALDVKDKEGMTPLHRSIATQHLDILEVFFFPFFFLS